MNRRLKKPLIVLLVMCVIGSVSYSLTYKGKSYVTDPKTLHEMHPGSQKEYENDLTYSEKQRVLHHYDSQPHKLVENDKVNNTENIIDLGRYDNPTNSDTSRKEGFQSFDKSEKKERTVDHVYDIQPNLAFAFKESRLEGITKVKPTKSSEDFKQEQERRRKVVEEVCNEFGVQKDAPETNVPASHNTHLASKDKYIDRAKMNNFYLARSASSMTCLLNKVASTSVAVALLKSEGRSIPKWDENISPHNAIAVLNPKTEAEFKFARKYFFKFLLVRHPFERLLSAYRDKVERANHWSLRLFRKHIIETLQNNSKSENQAERVSEAHINGMVEQGSDETVSRQIKENIYDTLPRNLPEQDGEDHAMSYMTVPKQKSSKVPTARLHKHAGNGSRNASILLNNSHERSNNQSLQEEEKLSTKSVRLARNHQVAIPNEAAKLQMHNRIFPSVKLTTKTSSFRYKRRISPPAAPTFRDFLEYILLSKGTDGPFSSHWSPYWVTCSPCSVSYDVIAKLESGEEDLQMVHDRIGLTKNTIMEGRLNKSPDFISSKQTTLASYYGQLDPTLIGRVYRSFALDYHLFEYDILDVFRLAGHCMTPVCNEMMDYL